MGLVVFEYSEDGRIFRVVDEFSQYQDPGEPTPPEITQLTGITDQMVKRQQLDKQTIFKLLNEASLIIAHCAAFDHACLEAQ